MARLTQASATEDFALSFHKDFMYLVMQKAPEFKISDLHPLQEHGYLVSCTLVAGAKLGIAGNVKHIVQYAT